MSETPLAVSINEASALAGIGRTKLYEAISDGSLPVRKLGRRSLVIVSDLQAWLERLPSVPARSRKPLITSGTRDNARPA